MPETTETTIAQGTAVTLRRVHPDLSAETFVGYYEKAGYTVLPIEIDGQGYSIIKGIKKFDDGGVLDTEEQIQTPYYPASESCNTLDTVVPNAMAIEQKRFNQRFKAAMLDMGTTVDEYVAKKLHYRSSIELCTDETGKVRFTQEQIDAVGTAIWNYENNQDAIIIADQTGVGKGRQAAGLIRYAILELKKVPFFFTEKKHLINDIFRDLIDIGFDAGVPFKLKQSVVISKTDYTDEELLKIIRDDIKDTEDVRVEFEFDDENPIELILKDFDETDANFEKSESLKEQLIELYRQRIIEDGGLESDVYVSNPDYDKQVTEALKKGRYLVTPFVPNSNTDIKDTAGNILYPAISFNEYNTIYKKEKKGTKWSEDPTLSIADMELPAKYKMFAMSYSQVGTSYYDYNGKKLLKSKVKLFQKYANDGVIILDESHNASGMNAQGELSNTGEIIFQFVKNSKMTTYLSATYAKRADNMPLYAIKTSIRESGLSDMEMITAFREGGNSLQEAVSAELTRNGQLLRREKIIQGKSDYYYENDKSEIGLNQIAKLDRIAALYKKVQDFSDEVRAVVKQFKKDLGDEEEAAKYKYTGGVNRLSFQLFNFMLLGLKIRQTTEFALKNLKSGKKTVITVANTMESALDNLSKTFMSNSGNDKYKIGDTIKNDFSLYIAYLLNYTMKYAHTKVIVLDEGGEDIFKETVYVLDSDDELSELIKDRVGDDYKVLLAEILASETGIPIAPIDQIKSIIKAGGFKINEITGRQRNIVFESGDYSEGVIENREIKKTDVVVREFNENELDCLIINQSGATGISMHALPIKNKVDIVYPATKNEAGEIIENAPTSLENKREVKKRAMIITQMELDINKEVQKLGRVNRTGQVYQPEYTYIISAIPSESRLTALMEKKLRSLSANVSSNQEQASYLFSSDDFFSDVAVSPFNETMNDIGMRGNSVTRGSQIQDFTKSMYFKPYGLQLDFFTTFARKLTHEIETLTAQGLYTGKMTSKEYFARTLATFPFFIGDNAAKTSFGRHSFIEKVNVTLYKEKQTEKTISKTILEKLKLKNGNNSTDADSFFTDLKVFQTEAKKRLDYIEKEKIEAIGRNTADNQIELDKYKKQLKEEKAKLSKFKKLEEGLAIEIELKDVIYKIGQGSSEISSAAMAGNMEEVSRITASITELTGKRKALEEKIIPYKGVLENKADFKEIISKIKWNEEYVNKYTGYIEKNTKALVEFSRFISLGKDYVMKIGTMQQLNVLDEKITYAESGDPSAVEYAIKHSEPVVITGVSFPAQAYDFTPGSFEVSMSGVAEKYSYSLYSLHREYDEKRAKIGFQPKENLTMLAESYKTKWNDIAGKMDNSYREDRYIIVGSLLRTFMLAGNNGITGQIIKYNTEDNKVRIGIEIADKKDLANGQKSVYKVLESRYSEDTNLLYPVYYDGNMENINRYITQYMYDYMIGNITEHIKNNVPFKDSKVEYLSGRTASKAFIFQISSSEKSIYLTVKANDEIVEVVRALRAAYENSVQGSKIKDYSIDWFTENLNVKIVSDSVLATDYFAKSLETITGTTIDENNYRVNVKSKYYPDLSPRKYRGGLYELQFDGVIFKNIFPTNIVNFEERSQYGFDVVSELTMSFDNLVELFKAFEAKRRKPSFATSSEYFDKFKSNYVFEQFSDEIEKVQPLADGDVQFVSEDNKDLDELINELVILLT